MENTQRVRRRQRRRQLSSVEVAYYILVLFLAVLMTIHGVVKLAVAVAENTDEKQPVSTVVVGEDVAEGEDDTQEDQSGTQTDSDTTDTSGDTDSTASDTDLTQYANDTGYAGALYQQLSAHPEAAYILRNLDLYPESLLEFVTKFPEAMAYGAAYLDYDRMGLTLSRDLSDADSRHSTVAENIQSILDSQGVLPLLLQWDSRWGYETYGDGLLGCTGCGPTCLSMVSLALTGWNQNDPYSVAQYAEENGYYVSGSGSAWTLMSEGSANFGLEAEELTLDENVVISALDEGKLVVCAMGPGDFTDNGHYIILAAYSDGAFIIRDPNSPSNSARTWTFDEIKDQIKNLWSFSAASDV